MTLDPMTDFKTCPHCNYSTGKEAPTNTFPCGSYMDNGLFYGSELCKAIVACLEAEAFSEKREVFIRSIIAVTFPDRAPGEFKDDDIINEIQKMRDELASLRAFIARANKTPSWLFDDTPNILKRIELSETEILNGKKFDEALKALIRADAKAIQSEEES